MERQVAALCRGMDPARYRPHVATLVEGFRSQELRAAGIPVFVLPLKTFLDPGPVALTGMLRAYIREHGIRLVHVFDAGLSLVSAAAARLSGVRLLSSQRFYMDLIPAK